ncbi:hypothetical protein KIW84_013063 [Lathyrus oleraceus]|uniref:Myosin motor domain-containing protein n=1 Tax=Pisum sativum TaxID=3888 RepID=A0A9D5BJ16_PEA|nr:hypothetical protein KIW84_013063 [Pisum sativum]
MKSQAPCSGCSSNPSQPLNPPVTLFGSAKPTQPAVVAPKPSPTAGEVTYETTAFLEKNRDLLHMDSSQLLPSSKCHLPQIFASYMLTQSRKPVVGPLHKLNGADSQKLSVATKFKGQVFQLMQRLENTTPHFIRCIKPNNLQSPRSYEPGLVLQQLRCGGVLEVFQNLQIETEN